MTVVTFRRRRSAPRTAADGHTWRAVPVTDYEADLLERLAGERPNAGTWRATLLGQIAERFHDAGRSR